MVQFASADTRKSVADLVDKLDDDLCLEFFSNAMLSMFIKRLARELEHVAYLGHCTASFVKSLIDETLFDDAVSILFFIFAPVSSCKTLMVDSSTMIFNCAWARADSRARFSFSSSLTLFCSSFISMWITLFNKCAFPNA